MHEMEIPVLPIPSVESINFTNPLILDNLFCRSKDSSLFVKSLRENFLLYHTNNIVCARLCLTGRA